MHVQNPLFIPGPTNLPERIRHAVNVPSYDHRAPGFFDTHVAKALENAKQVFRTTKGQIVLYAASGTGGWEAAVSSTLSPGDKVLICRNGTFSNRWIDLCQRHGLDVLVIEAEPGRTATKEAYRQQLENNPDVRAVLVTHSETSTGVVTDIPKVRAAMNAANSDAMMLVDGISSIASIDFRMDEWGVDVAIAGSQKGFMMPTGLTIIAVSPRAREAMESGTMARTYFAFEDMMNTNKVGNFPYTPSIPMLFGFAESVKMLLEEGMDNVYARHFRMAEAVRRAVPAWGLNLVCQQDETPSDSVTAIMLPEGFDSNALTELAFKKYGVSYGVGLDKIAGKAFRIGHLGATNEVMILTGLATAELAMKDLGIPVTLGAGVAAAQEYFLTSNS